MNEKPCNCQCYGEPDDPEYPCKHQCNISATSTVEPSINEIIDQLNEAVEILKSICDDDAPSHEWKHVMSAARVFLIKMEITKWFYTREQKNITKHCQESFSLCLDCSFHNNCSRYSKHREKIMKNKTGESFENTRTM